MTRTKANQTKIAEGWANFNGGLPNSIEDLVEFAEFFQECNTSPNTLSKQLIDTIAIYTKEMEKFERLRPDYTPLGMTLGYYKAAANNLADIRADEMFTLDDIIKLRKTKDLAAVKESLEILKLTAVEKIYQAIFHLFIAARELHGDTLEFTGFRLLLDALEEKYSKTQK